MNIITKILQWTKLNLASVLAMVQVIIKFIKEVLTLTLNVLFPAFPHSETFEATVVKVRDSMNSVDAWVQKIKDYLVIIVPATPKA